MSLQRLRVTGEGPLLGKRLHVYLDDTEITCCKSLSLEIRTDELPVVTLELMPGDLDISADTLAALVALVDLKRKRENNDGD